MDNKWHVFHKRELTEEEAAENPDLSWMMECDDLPEDGEDFLLYSKYGSFSIDTWDIDRWTEFVETAGGDDIEDGDAWMRLPEPPKEYQE